MKILIVEDEVIAASYLKQIVTNAGYKVVGTVGTGKGAIELAKSKEPDLILMDIMLKDNISGVDAAVQIGYTHPNIMIAFLTAYTEASMIETAKDAHTVGYFLKPYNKEEIVTNLHILASKTINPLATEQNIEIQNTIALNKNYCYDEGRKQLFLNKKEIVLTKKELELIELLCQNKHKVVSFEDIISSLWDGKTSQQTLRSLIYRIRQKTYDNFITSVSKRGYKLSS